MKRTLLYIAFLLSTVAYSQKEANFWYFGQNAGLKFNDNGTVTPLTDGKLNTTEGCSSISDVNGNLLFYTDGRTVWDRNHIEMPGGSFAKGTQLFGDPSSTQSAIIVPKPGNPNIYYIFTTDEPHNENANVYPNAFSGNYKDAPNGTTPVSTPNDDDGKNNGFNYSIVDLTVAGSNGSTGDVISRNNHLVTYNTAPAGEEIKYKCSEKVTAVKNDKNNTYWVVTHFINRYYAFKVSSSGVSTAPVVSTVGSNQVLLGYRKNAIGCLKASPNGKKLAIAHQQNGTSSGMDAFNTGSVELLDFDINTGKASNPKTIISGVTAYGVEFSPSSERLYTAVGSDDTSLLQFDLLNSDIPTSKKELYHSFSLIKGIQLAPNKKIYCAVLDKKSLAVINNPDELGTACNFAVTGQSLEGRTVKFGLPPFIASIFDPTFNAKNFCLGSATQFTLSSSQPVTSATWNFGDGATSDLISPSYQYQAAGSYSVSVMITSPTGKIVNQLKTITISAVPVANSVSNKSLCGIESMAYNLTQFNSALLGSQSNFAYGVGYFSSLADANNQQNVLPANYNLPLGSTSFYAKVYSLANPGCFATTSFTVSSSATPVANTADDVFVCDDAANDGKAIFDLQNESAVVLGGQDANQYEVSYHFSENDADANTSQLALNYQNNSNPQTIYARIQNKQNSNCYAITSFQIGVNKMPIAHQPKDLYLCDDESADGTEKFDLMAQASDILGVQTASDFNVAYYLSQDDADSNQNAIADISDFPNTANPQTIYVRIENKKATACFSTTSFQLNVKPQPVLTMDESYSICEGKSIEIEGPSGFSSYKWSNGETANSIVVAEAGNYSLTVAKDYGAISCQSTKTFDVYVSKKPTITKIDIQEWDNGTISVQAAGDGDYEYSIDGLNYQDSPVFTNLPGGSYTVYVNDKKGCGLATQEVYLLIYPKFFTPNGDGSNDVWKIEFSPLESEMKVAIFDRYGKLLKLLSRGDDSWNGKYNELEVPSNDYWFLLTRANGKQIKGHFSLIR